MHPYLLHFGHLYLPTFGALAAAGLMLALTLSWKTALLLELPPGRVWDAGIFAVVAAFVLSRLLLLVAHLAAFRAFPLLLLAVPSLTPSGLLLACVATVLWLRGRALPVLRVFDAWAPCGTLVWAFLALGHFFEGSDPGLRPSRPVALCVAAVAAALTLALFLFLRRSLVFWRRPNAWGGNSGVVAGVALGITGLAQFLLTFARQPGAPGPFGLEALQWVALGILLAGVVLLARASPLRKRVN